MCISQKKLQILVLFIFIAKFAAYYDMRCKITNIINTVKMKKLFYFLSIVCLLASCSKDSEPEPVVLTNEALTGTWVYDNTETGVTEILKFTKNGGFYYTTSLADAAFVGYPAGNYSISENVNLTAVGASASKFLDVTITKLSANSFTAKDKETKTTTTYAKLVETIQLAYLKSDTPGYTSLVEGNISSYKSHNEKVATVDSKGSIKAMAEGITLIDVITSKGTAVVLVKTEGLIPDYAKMIGYTKEKVVAEYGETSGEFNLIYHYDQYEVTFYVSKRTKVVERIKVEYTTNTSYLNQIEEYLKAKYYEDKSGSFYTDKNSKDTPTVKIEWDNYSELMYTYMNPDLFEDFSIAINQSVLEVKNMYAELEVFKETDYSIEYKIGTIQIGFTGVDKMDRVLFYHNGDFVTSAVLKLKKSVKQSDVEDFLGKKYGAVVNEDEYGILYYYDAGRSINIEYDSDSNSVTYNQ